MKRRCPVCHKVLAASIQSQSERAKYFPFCSVRCKLLDLGAWLDSEYRIVSGQESDAAGDSSRNAAQTDSDET